MSCSGVHSIVNLGKQKWSNRQDKYVRGGEKIYLPHSYLSSYRKNETLANKRSKGSKNFLKKINMQAKFLVSGCKENDPVTFWFTG